MQSLQCAHPPVKRLHFVVISAIDIANDHHLSGRKIAEDGFRLLNVRWAAVEPHSILERQ